MSSTIREAGRANLIVRNCKIMCRRACTEIVELSKSQRSLLDKSIGKTVPMDRTLTRSRVGDGLRQSSRSSVIAEVMVRRVGAISGLREMGNIHRPHHQAFEHGSRRLFTQRLGMAAKIKERQQDELFLQARKQHTENIESTEEVGLMSGESYAEFVNSTGSTNEIDLQKANTKESTERTESKKSGDLGSARDACVDRHGIHNVQVDEEVKRGLIADSEQPIGRVHKDTKKVANEYDVDNEEEHGRIQIDISEHGSFRTG